MAPRKLVRLPSFFWWILGNVSEYELLPLASYRISSFHHCFVESASKHVFYRFLEQTEVSQSALSGIGAILVKPKIWSILEKTWIFSKLFSTSLKAHLIKRCRKVKTKVFMYGWSFDIIPKRNMTSRFNQFRKSRLLFFVTSVQISILFVLKVWKIILTTLSTSKCLSKATFKKTQNMKETYNHHDLLKMVKS